MKAKVKLTYSVTLFVEGGSDDEISDWLAQTTPSETLKQVKEQTGNIYIVAKDRFSDNILTFLVLSSIIYL